MSNDIVSSKGNIVGQWDGNDANDLIKELARIKKESNEKVEYTGIPHQTQFPDDLKSFTAYILWACDKSNVCVVGSGANRVESVENIREFYANDVAKAAIDRHNL